MQQIIDNAQRNAGARASGAQRGPARAETAPQARPDAGQGVSQSDMLGLTQLLERLWNPNCDVAGGSAVKLRVKFLIDLSGNVLGRPDTAGSKFQRPGGRRGGPAGAGRGARGGALQPAYYGSIDRRELQRQGGVRQAM